MGPPQHASHSINNTSLRHSTPLEKASNTVAYCLVTTQAFDIAKTTRIAMAQNGTNPNLDSLSLSDTSADDTEDLFASPSVQSKKAPNKSIPQSSTNASPAQGTESEEDAYAAHKASLRRELSSLRSMNQVITGITTSLEKAKSNMDTVSATVNNAATLLTTWTRILSQTEHNQRLILNPNWQGATQDIADVENDVVLRQQEKERREADEARRARDREAEREEEERRRMTEGPGTKGSRGKGKAVGRGTGRGGTSGYVGVGGKSGARGSMRGGSTTGRPGNGIGRGLSGSRGRGRGTGA